MSNSESLKRLIKEMIRFAIVGVISYLVDTVTFLLFNRVVFGQSSDSQSALTSAALVIGYSVGILVNYALSRVFVFTADYQKENGKGTKSFVVFVVASLIGCLLTVLFTHLFIAVFGLVAFTKPYCDFLGKTVATGLVTIWNYLSRKLFVFK